MRKIILALAICVPAVYAADVFIMNKDSQASAANAARDVLYKRGCLSTVVSREKDFSLWDEGKQVRFNGGEFVVGCSKWKGAIPADPSAPTPPVEPTPTPGPANLNLTWTAPTKRTDGTTLAASEIGGFSILFNNKVTEVPGTARAYKFVNVAPGTYTVQMTATDTKGLVSAASATKTVTIM